MLTCAGREDMADYVKSKIPSLLVSYDNFLKGGKFPCTAFFNQRQAWSMAGSDPCVFLEDDIILCSNFIEKIEAEISKRPNEVIQFFSLRPKDLTLGSRYESGSNFLMHQCYYLPSGMARQLYEYSYEFYDECEDGQYIGPTDRVSQKYFKKIKLKYWLHVPSLVDHRVAKSQIDKRRSSKRQSLTFVE